MQAFKLEQFVAAQCIQGSIFFADGTRQLIAFKLIGNSQVSVVDSRQEFRSVTAHIIQDVAKGVYLCGVERHGTAVIALVESLPDEKELEELCPELFHRLSAGAADVPFYG